MKILMLGFVLLVFSSLSHSDNKFQNSVVQIFNQSEKIDYSFPWQQGRVYETSGSGVIIHNKQILTNAHVIGNSQQLQVRRVGSDKLFDAAVVYVSDERDLATIHVKDEEFFEGSEALGLGELPKLGDGIKTFGFPTGGSQLAITEGVVSRIDFMTYAHSGYKNLVCQIDAAINPGASGGPAIINGKIAGLSFQGIDSGENIGYIIPVSVINEFLSDIADDRVNGVPDIAFNYSSMQNQQMRDKYQMKPNQSGIVITKLSGFEKELQHFKKGDVILSIDGLSMGNDGTVASVSGDRILFRSFISNKQIHDIIEFSVLREGKKVEFEYPLSYTLSQSTIIPGKKANSRPDYVVVGGLVILEVTQDLMSDLRWWPRWAYMLSDDYKRGGIHEEDQVLLITQVLSSPINKDYKSNEWKQITSINGNMPKGLDHLRHILNEWQGEYVEIGTNDDTSLMVFQYEEMEEAKLEFIERYGEKYQGRLDVKSDEMAAIIGKLQL